MPERCLELVDFLKESSKFAFKIEFRFRILIKKKRLQVTGGYSLFLLYLLCIIIKLPKFLSNEFEITILILKTMEKELYYTNNKLISKLNIYFDV